VIELEPLAGLPTPGSTFPPGTDHRADFAFTRPTSNTRDESTAPALPAPNIHRRHELEHQHGFFSHSLFNSLFSVVFIITVPLSSSNHLTPANIISYHIISTLYRDPETPGRKDRKEQRKDQKTSAPLSETGPRLLTQSRPAGSPQGSDQRPYSSNSQYISLSSRQEALCFPSSPWPPVCSGLLSSLSPRFLSFPLQCWRLV
jgi:hypothetical protein